ncbi:MAG: hypothetical protein H7177_06675 [Rhizobacter sp.]|nr:hypothetical protein [Bacteriovorax sp.]
MKSLFIAILMINTSWASGSRHCLPSSPGKPSFCTGEKVIVDDGLQNSIGREGKVVGVFEGTPYVMVHYIDKKSRKEGKTANAYKVNSDDLVVTLTCHDNYLCNHL